MFNRSLIRYQLFHSHTGGEIPNHHAWYIPGRIVYHGAESWVVLECENPGCLGQAQVKLSTLTNGIPLGKVMPDPPGTQERYDREMEKQRDE